MRFVVLDRETELAEAVLATSPRALTITMTILALLLAAALLWAFLAQVDVVVTCTARVRSTTAPLNHFDVPAGQGLALPLGGQIADVHVREGALVERGTVLLSLDTRDLENEIALASQELRQERDQCDLDERHRQAQEELMAIEVAKQADRFARVSAVQQQGMVTASELVVAKLALDTAKAQLGQSRIPVSDARVRVAERRLANLRSRLVQSSLVAPFTGVVSAGAVQVGQVVQMGEVLIHMVEQSGFCVDVLIGSDDVGQVRPGMPARIKLGAFDYQTYGALNAKVIQIALDSDYNNGQAFFIARLSPERETFPDGSRIKLGMMGVGEILVRRERLLWLIVDDIQDRLVLESGEKGIVAAPPPL